MAISNELGAVREAAIPAGRIRYRERGNGPVLVFAHGAIVNGDVWRKVVPALAERYRCVTPDWPLGSHEIAMRPDADLSPPGVAQIILDFLEATELDDVTLISNDTATALVQLVLAGNPERVSRAVLTNGDLYERFFPFPFNLLTPLAYIPGAFAANRFLARSTKAKRRGYVLLSRTLKDPAILDSYADPSRLEHDIRRDMRKFLRAVRSRYTVDVARRLRTFTGPVLLVWSPDDRLFPIADARRLVDEFVDATLETVPSSRAYIPEDQPEALADHIHEFLMRTSKPPEPTPADSATAAKPG